MSLCFCLTLFLIWLWPLQEHPTRHRPGFPSCTIVEANDADQQLTRLRACNPSLARRHKKAVFLTLLPVDKPVAEQGYQRIQSELATSARVQVCLPVYAWLAACYLPLPPFQREKRVLSKRSEQGVASAALDPDFFFSFFFSFFRCNSGQSQLSRLSLPVEEIAISTSTPHLLRHQPFHSLKSK